jgi:RNase P subunit RPR2
MNNLDPAQVGSLQELAECLRQLHIRADKPSLRELEDRTKHTSGLLPGTRLKRARLGRTTINEVLRGFKLPKKAFLLTLVEILNVDLEADRRWEQAWDRLAAQDLDQAAEMEAEHLRQQLAEAKAQADRADKEAEQLRQQLAGTEALSRQQTVAGATAETRGQGGLLQAITAHAVPVSLSFEEAIDGLTVTLPGVTLEIPPAITDRQEFFYAYAEVRPHPVFGRDGRNLAVTVPMTRRELEQGAVIKVPAFRRQPVNLRIPPRTPTGRRFRIPGLGVRGPGDRNGDLIIAIHEVDGADKADEMRAELCTKARGETVTVDPVRESLSGPDHEGKGATERKFSSRVFGTGPGNAMPQARGRASDLRAARVIRLIADAEDVVQSITDERQKVYALAAAAKTVVPADPGRGRRLISEAERIALSITDEHQKAYALADVAKAVAAINPSLARQLIAEAERIAQSITGEHQKAEIWSRIAEAMAVTDPDGAERIALSITDEHQKAYALADVAKAMVPADPGRARRLISEAERIAQLITGELQKAAIRHHIAKAVAVTDPDGAERIAQSITDEYQRAYTLAGVAEVVAATYPGQAERIAQSITDEHQKAQLLGLIAKAVAAINPSLARQLIAEAKRIAQSITGEHQKAEIWSRIAGAMAVTDPDGAERVAQSITGKYPKTLALIGIAEAVAA